MEAPDREQTLKALLDARTPTRVEEVLDAAGIRLERSDLDLDQLAEFWGQLYDALDPAALDGHSSLAFHRLAGYARSAIHSRLRRLGAAR